MHHYRLGYRETLELPALVFFTLNQQIDRHRAEIDYRNVVITANSVGGGDGLEKLVDDLRKEQGQVYEIDEIASAMNVSRDRDGLMALKGLGKAS